MKPSIRTLAGAGGVLLACVAPSAGGAVLLSEEWQPSLRQPYVTDYPLSNFLRDTGFDFTLSNGWIFCDHVYVEGNQWTLTQDTFTFFFYILNDEYFSYSGMSHGVSDAFSRMTLWNLTLLGTTDGVQTEIVSATIGDASVWTQFTGSSDLTYFSWTLPRDVRAELDATDQWAFRIEGIPAPAGAGLLAVVAASGGWRRRR